MRLSRDTRDAILFWFSLAGVGYETVIEKVDKPSLLALFGAVLVGLGVNRDTNRQEKKGDGS